MTTKEERDMLAEIKRSQKEYDDKVFNSYETNYLIGTNQTLKEYIQKSDQVFFIDQILDKKFSDLTPELKNKLIFSYILKLDKKLKEKEKKMLDGKRKSKKRKSKKRKSKKRKSKKRSSKKN